VALLNAKGLRFYESGSVNFTLIRAATQSADVTLVLPAAQGAANSLLQNDGAGALSWAAAGSLGFVPTSRTISTTSPLTGGGDLSANRTFAFDQTVDLNNNARVGVRKNSTGSTFLRRRINLIEGSNVTLTVADDSGSEEVDVTIAASSSGGGGGYPAALGYAGI